LPGSRLSEIRSHIDTIFDCITELGIIYPHAKFIIALSDKLDVTEEISESCRDLNKKNIDVVLEVAKTHNVILASDIVISCSGTASLEVALLKTPLIIFYKTSFISYLIFKTVSLVKFIGLPNLIMEQKVVPELVQDKFNTKNLTHEIIKILESQEIRDSQIEAFNLIEKKLSGKNATDNVFKIIDKILLGARF
jgi:lipid-A-disaccharide synthase